MRNNLTKIVALLLFIGIAQCLSACVVYDDHYHHGHYDYYDDHDHWHHG